MLRPGFLRALSDWVSEYYALHHSEMEKALKEFEFSRLLEYCSDPEKLAGIFSEWLVFDRKSLIFDDTTGLEYFVKHNPLGVTADDLAAYKDLLEYKVGIFSIQSVDNGRTVTLADMRGREYVVHDVTASMHLSRGAIWTRIASVAGLYQMVGSLFIPLPLEFGAGYKRMAASWGERSMDAHEAAIYLSGAPPAKTVDKREKEIFMYDSVRLTREECEAKRSEYGEEFEQMLRACGMQEMFSLRQFDRWLTDEQRFPLGFATKALFFLIPENVSERDGKRLMNAGLHYGNYVPRPALKGRCPSEIYDEEIDSNPNRLIVQDTYTHELYMQPLEIAYQHTLAHEWRKAYDVYSEFIQELLKDKVPMASAFRVFANAAVSCFNESNARFALGESLLLAALRLNPHYDFGLRIKREHLDPLDNFSVLPKGISKRDIQLIKDMRAVIKKRGERQYHRTVFRKYEDFLKESGISLSHQSKSVVTVIQDNDKKTNKVGRNEPCPCGSGKKYKKCHGAVA